MRIARFGAAALALYVAACGGRDSAPASRAIAPAPAPAPPPIDAAVPVVVEPPPPPPAPPIVPPAPAGAVWLRGSTHVHAAPSGDSKTPIPDVIAWYEAHGYDFIALTDHNRISEVDPTRTTAGQVAVRAPGAKGLVVLAGVELTHNPDGCQPPGDGTEKCRIHANLIGVEARPPGKLDWANRKTNSRVEKYRAAITQRDALGGIAQVNHGQWLWGMSAELLAELARMGFRLVEIENAAFPTWMAGDATHPSMETLWDAALVETGLPLWGVATDDAHHYDGTGKYPAGGAWIAVQARRDPASILEAIQVGRFYASTGVELTRADVEGDSLVIQVAAPVGKQFAIDLVANGQLVGTVPGAYARLVMPASGYVRAVVRRLDRAGAGQRAWVQPRWAQPAPESATPAAAAASEPPTP